MDGHASSVDSESTLSEVVLHSNFPTTNLRSVRNRPVTIRTAEEKVLLLLPFSFCMYAHRHILCTYMYMHYCCKKIHVHFTKTYVNATNAGMSSSALRLGFLFVLFFVGFTIYPVRFVDLFLLHFLFAVCL